MHIGENISDICKDCLNLHSCVVDASANVVTCGQYVPLSHSISNFLDRAADILADKIIERLKDEGVQNANKEERM